VGFDALRPEVSQGVFHLNTVRWAVYVMEDALHWSPAAFLGRLCVCVEERSETMIVSAVFMTRWRDFLLVWVVLPNHAVKVTALSVSPLQPCGDPGEIKLNWKNM